MAETVRLALAQVPPIPGDLAANLERIDSLAARAADSEADLLVLPEMVLTGYAIGAEQVRALAESADGPSARRIAGIARSRGVAIAYGYPRLAPGGEVHNAAALINDAGAQVLNYAKTHLFGDVDAGQFAPGEALPTTAQWRGWSVGLAVCYDVEFPEVGRWLAAAGTDLALVPTANMTGFDEVSRLLVPARALENGMFVAYANFCGSDARFDYGGLSVVAGPDGKLIAEAGRGEELLIATIEPGALSAARERYTYLADRRQDLHAGS